MGRNVWIVVFSAAFGFLVSMLLHNMQQKKEATAEQQIVLEQQDSIIICKIRKFVRKDETLTYLEAVTESGERSFRGGAVTLEKRLEGVTASNTETWGTVFDPTFGQYVSDPQHSIANLCLSAMKK